MQKLFDGYWDRILILPKKVPMLAWIMILALCIPDLFWKVVALAVSILLAPFAQQVSEYLDRRNKEQR